MLDLIIVFLIAMMVTIMVYSESKYMFSKPTYRCGESKPKNIQAAEQDFSKVISAVKKQTQKLQKMMKQTSTSMDTDGKFVEPIEHIAASPEPVVGANMNENQIDETLPFSDFEGLPVKTEDVDGTIQGVRPPTYADPRVMNPSLAAAPVQFSDPAQFGTFGVTDDVSPAFSTPSEIQKTNAETASDATLEGFENGGIVMNGKIVESACELPNYQLKGVTHHTTLPQRSLFEPPPTVQDLLTDEIFDGLQGYPVTTKDDTDLLTPPGEAKPASEWAFVETPDIASPGSMWSSINYGVTV